MRNEFTEFRNCYIEYLREYDFLKFLQNFIENADVSENIKGIEVLSHKLALLFTRLRFQLHDSFVDEKEKGAYIKSVRDFATMEIDQWENWRERNVKEYYWDGKPRREWMPNCLYDILKEVKKVEGESSPHNKKEKPKKEDSFENYLTKEGVSLLPKLIKEFHNSQPRQMAFIWVAMNDLSLITENISNYSHLHRILSQSFGQIGSLARFNDNMKDLKLNRTPYQDNLIEDYISKIRDLQLS